jgi:methionyl-tRNA formyltransferase
MNIVFLGSGYFGIRCLEAILQTQHRLAFVVSQPPHPAGRGRKPSPTPVAEWAPHHGVRLLETGDVNTCEAMEAIASHKPDLILVIAFGQKIGRPLVDLPHRGAINVHASLLPRWRGAAPINWAIMAGDAVTGVSLITLADKIDAGLVLAQDRTPIEPDETAGGLHDRLALLAAPLLEQTLDRIEQGTVVYQPQDDAQVTLARKLKKSDGFLDFADSAGHLVRKIRGLWPWPGAMADYLVRESGRCVRITIAGAKAVEGQPGLAPGTFDDRLCVTCGQGALQIAAIKPAGSALMDFRDFVNGRRTRPGDALIPILNSEG